MSSSLILLVDDAPDVAFLVKHYAAWAGQKVVHHADAAAAWEFLQLTQPDLAILDVHLPGESGLDLCRRIRAAAPLAGLVVALFCNWDADDDLAAGLDAGADAVLTKDLLGQPEAWQARIQEQLRPLPSQPLTDSRNWTATYASEPPPEGWITALNQTLRHPDMRQLAPCVVQVINRRAMQRAMTACGRSTVAQEERACFDATEWLLSDGRGLNPDKLISSGCRGIVAAFAASLAEQMRALIGADASAPIRAALGAALPVHADCREHS